MSEKLDLFEMTVKRGLENYELPLDRSAWSEFEKALDGANTPVSTPSSGAGILPKFGLAAAVLVGALVFINQSADEPRNVHSTDEVVHEHTISDPDGSPLTNMERSKQRIPQVATIETHSSEETIVVIHDEEFEGVESSLTESEKERMERINSKLREVAERASSDSNDPSSSEGKNRSTTRYLGADFNLGAAKSFSPDDDGKHDSFMPSRLEEGDIFLMTISTEEGRIVFKSSDIASPWEGKDTTGNYMDSGRYSWEVILQKDNKKEIFKGTVHLER